MRYFIKTSIMIVIVLFTLSCEDAVKELTTTISGTITDAGQPVQGAYVFALQGISVEDLLSLDIELSSGTKVFSETGRFTIPALSPGTFQIIAIEDVDSNMSINYDTDRIGIYGEVTTIGENTIPLSLYDVIIINKGDDIEDINIEHMFDFDF